MALLSKLSGSAVLPILCRFIVLNLSCFLGRIIMVSDRASRKSKFCVKERADPADRKQEKTVVVRDQLIECVLLAELWK